MGSITATCKSWFSICAKCKFKNVEGKKTRKPANIGFKLCRTTRGHKEEEYILTQFPKEARVGCLEKNGDKWEWHTFVVTNHWKQESSTAVKCMGGLSLKDEADGTEKRVEYLQVVNRSLRRLDPDFKYTVPYTLHEPHTNVSKATFKKLVESAGKAATLHDFVVIQLGDFKGKPMEEYVKAIEPLADFVGEEVPKTASFAAIRQRGGNMESVSLTQGELLKKLKTTEMGFQPRGTPREEVDRAHAAQHPKEGTPQSDAFYLEEADWKTLPRRKGDIRLFKPSSFSPEDEYLATVVGRKHKDDMWVLLESENLPDVVKDKKEQEVQDLELVPDLVSDSDSDDEEEDDNKVVSMASATNWAWSTPREAEPHRKAQMRYAEQVKGATMGGPLIATAGAGTVVHEEQAALSSANVCHYGLKTWYYGNGLRQWRDENGGDFDVLSKDVRAFPTVEECERYRIKVFVQTAGTVVLTRAGLPHTVLSLTTTVAEATNLVLDQDDWVLHLLKEVKMYLPHSYPVPIKPGDGSKEPGKLSEKQLTVINRLSTWVEHTGEYLRVQANGSSKPFEECHVGDIMDVGGEYAAIYAMKTTTTDLVYVLPVTRGERLDFHRVPLLSFGRASAHTFPLIRDDGSSDKGGQHETVVVTQVQEGLLDTLSSEEVYHHVAEPEHFGQPQSCQVFGMLKGLYDGWAVGKSLAIVHHIGWPRSTPRPHEEEVRIVPSTTRFFHANTRVGVLPLECALLPVVCSLRGTCLYPCRVT